MPDPLCVTTPQHHPDGTAAEDPADGGGLGTVITNALTDVDKSQKDLAAAVNIQYTTLNHWLRGTRGTSRVDPEVWRRIAGVLRDWGADVTTAEIFRAAGRRVPGPADEERELYLLGVYRSLPVDSQRALIQHADLLKKSARAS
ncbi:helix-turn-helix domain-containing protein [Streptomyces liangshanensis]|uniref:helix-turn-helix domain-containing protein n=1 Tax=Streptomyces liangshanensis TaxID=2717324 RepID=UPI0036D7B181